ncbi:MAG: hypothetical protein AB7V50_05080 [Vampirovibrionia bacterium]
MAIRYRLYKGSALVDYIVPTAVVGLVVGLALFTLQKDNLLRDFITVSSGTNVAVSDGTLAVGASGSTTNASWNTSESVSAAVESGTSPPLEGSETINCSGGVCTISAAGYTLTGIPEDIADFVATSSVSGGDDVFANVLDQIIEQIEAQADPSESTIISALKNLAQTIGEEPYDPSLTAQYASNHYVLEYLITGNDPEGRIVDDGTTVSDTRITQVFDKTDPQLFTKLKDGTVNANTDILMSKVQLACSMASMSNSKDYSSLVNLVGYLQSQSKDINSEFYSSITDQVASQTDLSALKSVDLQSVKDNVASKLQDVTAASIIAAAEGNI